MVTPEELYEIADNFKKLSGLNNINMKVIKVLMKSHQDVFLNIVNQSLFTGTCPEVWKYTIVTPIQKVKGSIKAADMRPVNVAPTMDKLIQAVVKKQLDEHINRNNILS